jgi:hypothetical protein
MERAGADGRGDPEETLWMLGEVDDTLVAGDEKLAVAAPERGDYKIG